MGGKKLKSSKMKVNKSSIDIQVTQNMQLKSDKLQVIFFEVTLCPQYSATRKK